MVILILIGGFNPSGSSRGIGSSGRGGRVSALLVLVAFVIAVISPIYVLPL